MALGACRAPQQCGARPEIQRPAANRRTMVKAPQSTRSICIHLNEK
jgi:hypothetical protein